MTAKGRLGDFIYSHLKNAVRMIMQESNGQLSLSKFGGLPYADAEIFFPKDKNGRSAIFLCQFHIAELNQWFISTKEFPKDGVLYFFVTLKNENGYETFDEIIVQYADEIEEIKVLPLPQDLEKYGVLTEQDLMVIEEVNIPPFETSLWTMDDHTEEEKNSYWYIEAILGYLNALDAPKFLGHPDQVQSCVLMETELKHTKQGWYDLKGYDQENFKSLWKQLEPSAAQWRQLLEIDMMDDYFKQLSLHKVNESMDGKFYLMIKLADFEVMDFSKTETVYQCT
jgi:uncharacterized protein YwqG